MPIRKTNKGYKWGKTGKTYTTKKQALKQSRIGGRRNDNNNAGNKELNNKVNK